MIKLADLQHANFTGPWFVARALPGQDGKARDALLARRYQPYRPTMPALRNSARGQARRSSKSMFPTYILLRDIFGIGWDSLRTISSIHRLWVFNGKLATLENDAVEAIRATEERLWKQEVESKTLDQFTIGQVLPVRRGAFFGFLAEIEALDDDQRVDVLIEIFGRKTRISMPPEHLLAS